LLSLKRHGVRLALAAALSCLALPAAAHAALVQGVPTNVQAGYHDDHSIGGDDHMGWSFSGSESEPMAIAFGTTLTNTFGAPFQVCGYDAGGGWMRAYEIGTACPPGDPGAGQDGWFRYVAANHSDASPPAFNRWHLMDLQRFALVPLAGRYGPAAGTPTAWDTFWGTCLSNATPTMDCEQNAGAASTVARINPGQVKTTQEQNPAPDAERIAISTNNMYAFPDGYYQVVAIANPYGHYSGPATVSCVTIALSGVANYHPVATQVGGIPQTCYVPTNIPGPTGPGLLDPMAGSGPTTPPCTLLPATGHCWAAAPASGAHPLARSTANAASTPNITPTRAVPVAQAGGTDAPPPPPASGASNPPATAAGQPVHKPVRRLTARQSRSYARRALRKQFGKHLHRLKVSCRVRHSTAATCKVTYRKAHGYSYKGHVWLRYKTVRHRLRWQYRMEIKKHKRHHKTRTVHRGYRTGGTF
jgi:hypothetical protein